MVRVFIKGGVWKNSEDEILKAAVMKYGKQQWARVASLLNRKSAKQCKARWNEWLDPSVRKVEWSRAEDEKLLHLAKLLPAQWRTIGPLVGRTATQCQERYERLLDEAASAAAGGGDPGAAATGSGAEEGAVDEHAAAAAAHARKLRPGQIDPHPETRPARPDPVDMDEDEIEMLQEARARLANTQGKKAKRKERERMLAEAKRLADLQKRRELKQAGLLSGAARTRSRTGKKRRREIDFGVEIPFHKPAPAGFHSTENEDARAEDVRAKRAKSVDFRRVNEAQYRSRDREAQLAQKKEEARLRALERSNMQYVVAEVSKRNDPVGVRKRGALEMPAPAVTDEELERVARLSHEQEVAGLKAPPHGKTGASATDALLGDYSDRPLPTPLRTPLVGGDGKPSAQEVILREASNLLMIERGQTPLLGGDNPDLRAGGAGTGIGLDGKEGVAKTIGDAALSVATPMVGKTPSATPMTSRGAGDKTPMSRAPRDELGLNRPTSQMHQGMSGSCGDDVSVSLASFATTTVAGGMSIKELARAERRAAKRARLELEAALAALPAPQFEYELAAPDVVTEEEEEEEGKQPRAAAKEKDAADRDREEAEARRREAAKIYDEWSTVMKRPELPRPMGAVTRAAVFGGKEDEHKIGGGDPKELVREEMLALLQHDAHAHPVPSTDIDGDIVSDKKSKKDKKKKKRKKGGSDAGGIALVPLPDKPLDYISGEALDAAKGLVNEELEAFLYEGVGGGGGGGGGGDGIKIGDALVAKNMAVSASGASSILYLDDSSGSAKGWTHSSDGTATTRLLDSLRTEHTTLSDVGSLIRKKADKLEARLDLRHGGYVKRHGALREEALRSFAEMRHAAIEAEVYVSLLAQETGGATSRIEGLQAEVRRMEEDEAQAQRRYGELLRERNRLRILSRQRNGD